MFSSILKSRTTRKDSRGSGEFHKSIGFKNGKELENFIEKNSISSNDSIQLKKSEIIQQEIEELTKQRTELKYKVLNDNDKLDFVGWIGITLFGILFILRYLIYTVKWSLRTLKEK